MPPAKKTAAKAARPDEPDLLSDLKDDGPAVSADDSEETFDLLDGLSEDEGTPWIPDDDDDPSPEGIQGRVTYVGEVASDYGDEMCPLITLEASDGTIWSVRGYSTVLRNQINKAAPKIGDWMACRYFGIKQGRAREYKNYKVAVKHA